MALLRLGSFRNMFQELCINSNQTWGAMDITRFGVSSFVPRLVIVPWFPPRNLRHPPYVSAFLQT